MPPVIIAAAGLAVLLGIGPAISIGLLTSVALGQFLFGIGASLVLSGISGMLQKKPSSASVTTSAGMGSRTVSVRQANAPWRILIGRSRTGGVITFGHFTGSNNDFLHLVYTISGHQIQSVDTVNFDGVPVALNGTGDATDKYAGFVHCEFNLGTPTQEAFPGLVAAAPDKWTFKHRQRGRAGVYVRLKWNSDLFPNGVPNITFDVHGANQMNDPRTGHLTDYSENPAIILRYWLGASFGLGDSPLGNVDQTLLLAAANICDEAVTLAAGGTEPRYTCNGSYTVDELPRDVIASLLTSMAGTLVYADGNWKMYAGTWRPTTINLGDGDMRGPIRWQPLASRRDLANTVRGTFSGPVTNWQPADFPVVTNPIYVGNDGGETIPLDIVLPFTITPSTAQRLAKIALERARRQGQGTFPYKLIGLQAEVCDVINVTHPRFGWQAKTMEVFGLQFSADEDDNGAKIAGVVLSLREADAAIYAWNPATDEKPMPQAPSSTLLNTTDISNPTNVNAFNDPVLQATGVTIDQLTITWTAPRDIFVTDGGAIEVQFRDHADFTTGDPATLWKDGGEVDGSVTTYHNTALSDGHTYDVRIRARNANGVTGPWLETDNILINGYLVMSPIFAKQGSIRPSTFPVFTVATNSNNGSGVCTIRLTAPATQVPLTDGNFMNVPAVDVTWNNLAGVTTYDFAPRYKISDGTVHFATGGNINVDADPPTVPLTSAASQDQKNQMAINQAFDGYMILSPGFITVTTPNNGGTGGGSSGGGGICVHEDEIVEAITARGHGRFRLGDLKPGDFIAGVDLATHGRVMREVLWVQKEYCADWYNVRGCLLTAGHPVRVNGRWTPAHDAPGAIHVTARPGQKMKIEVKAERYDDHNFVIFGEDGEGLVAHNWPPNQS